MWQLALVGVLGTAGGVITGLWFYAMSVRADARAASAADRERQALDRAASATQQMRAHEATIRRQERALAAAKVEVVKQEDERAEVAKDDPVAAGALLGGLLAAGEGEPAHGPTGGGGTGAELGSTAAPAADFLRPWDSGRR